MALIPPSVTTPDPTADGIGSREQPSGTGGYFKTLQRKFHQDRELGKISEFRNTGFYLNGWNKFHCYKVAFNKNNVS